MLLKGKTPYHCAGQRHRCSASWNITAVPLHHASGASRRSHHRWRYDANVPWLWASSCVNKQEAHWVGLKKLLDKSVTDIFHKLAAANFLERTTDENSMNRTVAPEAFLMRPYFTERVCIILPVVPPMHRDSI